jgi:hypothetical protein
MWWEYGNTLALVEAMTRHARDTDNGWQGEANKSLNSHLVGSARAMGMSEDAIREAFASDRCLTIYEP